MNLCKEKFYSYIGRFKISWRRHKGLYIVIFGIFCIIVGLSLFKTQSMKVGATVTDFSTADSWEDSLDKSSPYRGKYDKEKYFNTKYDSGEESDSHGKLIFSVTSAQRPYALTSPFVELPQSKKNDAKNPSKNHSEQTMDPRYTNGDIPNQGTIHNGLESRSDRVESNGNIKNNKRQSSGNTQEPSTNREPSIALQGIIQGSTKQAVLQINNASVVLGVGETYGHVRVTAITNESVSVSVLGVEQWLGI